MKQTQEKTYGNGAKEVITWIFFIFALAILVFFIILLPYMKSYFETDLTKSGKSIFNIIFYSFVYFLVAMAFLSGFIALFYSFLYSFSRKIILTDKTFIFKEIFKKREIQLKNLTLFAIGKVDLPIVYSTGFGAMGSISAWDYPSIYYKKNKEMARLVLPWFQLDDFINELRKRAPWVKIKIPKKFLNKTKNKK